MSRVDNVVFVEVPCRRDKHLKCFRRIRVGGKEAPFNPPIKDLGAERLPKDTFQRQNETKK